MGFPRFVTPLGWAAARWSLGSRALRWSTSSALVVGILVVLGGGVVRVTASGLGCPTAPLCDGSSLTPIPALGIHGVIEFSNRLVTVLLIVAVGWAIIAIRLQRPWSRSLSRLSWSMFWLVVANAVVGAFSVNLRLNPYIVVAHFLLAMLFLATATVTWHRARWPGDRAATVRASHRLLAWALLSFTAVLIVVGTIVSGAGPHSGDSSDVQRIGVSWITIVWIHAIVATLVILLTVVAIALLRGTARRRAVTLLVVLLLQWGVGGVQALTGLPAALVAIHLVGAALVWVGALRLLLDADPALLALRTPVATQPDSASAR
jgi:cytochrome c oxidase assembly protein subunit 15